VVQVFLQFDLFQIVTTKIGALQMIQNVALFEFLGGMIHLVWRGWGSARFGAVWHGLARFGTVWHGLAWFGLVWLGLARVRHAPTMGEPRLNS
jgi:hypothetical protein